MPWGALTRSTKLRARRLLHQHRRRRGLMTDDNLLAHWLLDRHLRLEDWRSGHDCTASTASATTTATRSAQRPGN